MSAPAARRARVVVHGRVQGVWFRDSCRYEAQSRDVAGWVRNNPDGTVEAAFEGGPDAVSEMIAWAHEGPPRAEVADVEVHEEQPRGEDRFRVR